MRRWLFIPVAFLVEYESNEFYLLKLRAKLNVVERGFSKIYLELFSFVFKFVAIDIWVIYWLS